MIADVVAQYFSDGLAVMTAMQADTEGQARIAVLVNVVVDCLRRGGRVFWAGNGGSAADAQHLSAELLGRFRYTRPGLASYALTADSAACTAIANDFGYDQIFAHQLSAMARAGDIFFALSTSGASPNIVTALSYARAHRMITVGFTGQHPESPMCALLDHVVMIPSQRTELIQEAYMRVGHVLCACVEACLFPQTPVMSSEQTEARLG